LRTKINLNDANEKVFDVFRVSDAIDKL